MSKRIENVAVLGAGVMGAQIAGHLSNAGIPSYLFDINKELTVKGKETLATLKPAPLYKPKNIDCLLYTSPSQRDATLSRITYWS